MHEVAQRGARHVRPAPMEKVREEDPVQAVRHHDEVAVFFGWFV